MFIASSLTRDASTLAGGFFFAHSSFKLDCWGGAGLTDLGISKNLPRREMRRTQRIKMQHETDLGFAGGPLDETRDA